MPLTVEDHIVGRKAFGRYLDLVMPIRREDAARREAHIARVRTLLYGAACGLRQGQRDDPR